VKACNDWITISKKKLVTKYVRLHLKELIIPAKIIAWKNIFLIFILSIIKKKIISEKTPQNQRNPI